jgi:hypothetical protein
MGREVRIEALIKIDTTIELNDHLNPEEIRRNPKKILQRWLDNDGDWYMMNCVSKMKVMEAKLKNKRNKVLVD